MDEWTALTFCTAVDTRARARCTHGLIYIGYDSLWCTCGSCFFLLFLVHLWVVWGNTTLKQSTKVGKMSTQISTRYTPKDILIYWCHREVKSFFHVIFSDDENGQWLILYHTRILLTCEKLSISYNDILIRRKCIVLGPLNVVAGRNVCRVCCYRRHGWLKPRVARPCTSPSLSDI